MKRHIVLGTAGHIDHGKTALVKSLTNMDTDRLNEEKQRGMTIDLGFAYLGDNITIIDVPGHEKFIRNMVAGVSTIDLVLLVIAADDSIMPQTTEHLEILNLLQIKHGIIVLTKTDLVEDDWLDLVEEEVRELVTGTFLEKSSIFRVSNQTGAGVTELSQKILEMAASIPPRQDRGIFRLPIDRIFTMKGFGSVTAGTVLSGSVKVDETVELLPQQKKLRIRGLQIHGQSVKQVRIGDRAAINLANIDKSEIQRGDVLAAPDIYQPTIFFDAQLYLLKSAPRAIRHNSRIRLHIGTSEIMARIRLLDADKLEPGSEAFIQLYCEAPVVAEINDRFVIRRYSPIQTIGGGVILQVNPPRHKRFSPEIIGRLEILAQGNLLDIVEQSLLKGKQILKTTEDLVKLTNVPEKELMPILEELEYQGTIESFERKRKIYFIHASYLLKLEQELLNNLENFHQNNPLRQGVTVSELHSMLVTKTELFFIQMLLNDLVEDQKVQLHGDKIRLADYKIELSDSENQLKDRIEQLFLEQKFAPPNPASISSDLKIAASEVDKIIAYLMEHRILIYVDDGLLMHQKWISHAREVIEAHFKKQSELTMSEFRDLIGTSRKYAVPLLNYFDQQGLTVRQEDVRVLNQG